MILLSFLLFCSRQERYVMQEKPDFVERNKKIIKGGLWHWYERTTNDS